MYAVTIVLVSIVCSNDESSVMGQRIGVDDEDIMVVLCLVGVSVLCVVMDPACQSNEKPYNVQLKPLIWGIQTRKELDRLIEDLLST
jgi:hypothetical protein